MQKKGKRGSTAIKKPPRPRAEKKKGKKLRMAAFFGGLTVVSLNRLMNVYANACPGGGDIQDGPSYSDCDPM